MRSLELDGEHVRPLLPGGQSTMVVVTSRNQLASLVAAEGAQLSALLMPDHCTRLGASPMRPITTKSRTVAMQAPAGGVPPRAAKAGLEPRVHFCGASTPLTATTRLPNWAKRQAPSLGTA